MKTISFVLVFFILSTFLFSTIINVPGDQPTIQEGINVAVDTDTVLVQPGTYVENINYNGKLITVASLFLTTQDTTYISQTVIDGSQPANPDLASVVTFANGEDSTAVLTGFTLTDGNGTLIPFPHYEYYILGGGIFCANSNPSLVNVKISYNTAELGGGICCTNSSLRLLNVTISDNTADRGGGMECWDSNPILVNVIISNNVTGYMGYGGGGGIYCGNSSPSLKNITIINNSSDYGGGISCYNSTLNFDPINRCNIYLNFAGSGCDLYAYNCNTIEVIVDTFTVLQPDDYFASPNVNFTFDILNAKVEQIDQDLCVSPTGSNENSGLTADDPLLTVYYALAKIFPDSINTLSIHLSNGTYSSFGTSEIFPLFCRSYVSLIGDDELLTILDGEGSDGILVSMNDTGFSMENMTIQNGYANGYGGGGIFCNNSSTSLMNVIISGNSADYNGGGICCRGSSQNLVNVTITGNSAGDDGGGIFCRFSDLNLTNVNLSNNSAANHGGGFYCYSSNPNLTNVNISNNSTVFWKGGGIFCNHSDPNLTNVTISNNSAGDDGGGIYVWDTNLSLTNCILWNDMPEEIYFYFGSVTATYSNIEGGWTGEGNIDEDPLFVGTGVFPYSLLEDSPCIDAGNPDPIYYDPEDPTNPGYALYPAMGTIINDMGAYGGPNAIGWPPVGLEDNVIIQTSEVFLQQNYPNPFNPTTNINYSLKENSKVSLSIYNIKGQKVKQLVSEQLSAGQHSVVWNGKDNNGKSVSSGIYFYKLRTDNFEKTRKMILIK